MLALRRAFAAASRRGTRGARAVRLRTRVLAPRMAQAHAPLQHAQCRAFSSGSGSGSGGEKPEKDNDSNGSEKPKAKSDTEKFGGGVGGWFKSRLASFFGAVQQKQVTTTLASLTSRYRRMQRLLERIATDPSTKHMAADLQGLTKEVNERLALVQRTAAEAGAATMDQWTDRSVTRPWERVTVDSLKLVTVHEKQMRMTLMRLTMAGAKLTPGAGAGAGSGSGKKAGAEDDKSAAAVDDAADRQVKGSADAAAQPKGKERRWIQSAAGSSTAPDAQSEPPLSSVLKDLFGAGKPAAAGAEAEAQAAAADAKPTKSVAANAVAAASSAASAAVDTLKAKAQQIKAATVAAELPAWLRLYNTHITSADAVAARQKAKISLRREIAALEERLNELDEPARAWTIVPPNAVRLLIDERLQANVLDSVPRSAHQNLMVYDSAAVQLEGMTGLSEADFLEGARMAYQTLVREFNRANTDPDAEFDADGVLTTKALRRVVRDRITRWREIGLQSQVSIANALLPPEYTLPPEPERAGHATFPQIPAPTTLISPHIRAELLSCVASGVSLHVDSRKYAQMFIASLREQNEEKQKVMEQTMAQAMSVVDQVATAQHTRTVRVLVSVLIAADEQVHLDAAFTKPVAAAISASRAAEEDREQRALNTRPKRAAAPAAAPKPSADAAAADTNAKADATAASAASDAESDAAAAVAPASGSAVHATTANPGARLGKAAHYHVWTFSTTIALNPQGIADRPPTMESTKVAPSAADLTWRVSDINGCIGLLPEWITTGNADVLSTNALDD